LYLLTRPDVPFVQDGVRDGEKIRDWMHDRFAQLLPATGVPVEIIEGDFTQRLPTAIAHVQRLIESARH
jgi:HTH-type transcriptional regulator, transcriptional repressor of NAD biosynthesis genes